MLLVRQITDLLTSFSLFFCRSKHSLFWPKKFDWKTLDEKIEIAHSDERHADVDEKNAENHTGGEYGFPFYHTLLEYNAHLSILLFSLVILYLRQTTTTIV